MSNSDIVGPQTIYSDDESGAPHMSSASVSGVDEPPKSSETSVKSQEQKKQTISAPDLVQDPLNRFIKWADIVKVPTYTTTTWQEQKKLSSRQQSLCPPNTTTPTSKGSGTL